MTGGFIDRFRSVSLVLFIILLAIWLIILVTKPVVISFLIHLCDINFVSIDIVISLLRWFRRLCLGGISLPQPIGGITIIFESTWP